MQKATNRKVAILAVPGALSTAIAGPCDVLRTASVLTQVHGMAGPRFTTSIVGLAAGEVETFGGLRVAVDPVPTRSQPDAIIVAAAGVEAGEVIERARGDIDRNPTIAGWLRRAVSRGALVSSGCVGVAWLAAAGLIDGRRVTTSFWLHAALARAYPEASLDRHAMVVQDGPVVTAGAAMAYLDLALHVVGQLGTPQLRKRCADILLLDDQRRSQAMFATVTHLDTQDPLVRRAAALMHERTEGGSLAALSRNLGVAPRTLQRRFSLATGATPKDYWQRIRLERACYRLETTQKNIAEVADAAGYLDVSAFHRAFTKLMGIGPSAYRARFRGHVD